MGQIINIYDTNHKGANRYRANRNGATFLYLQNRLRELGPATANPGDAHVKVGSERESATSDNFANRGVDEIGVYC